MNEQTLKVRVARQANLCAAAMDLLVDEPAPRDYFDRLVADGMPTEAIRFLACGLPKREAVWWGCLCVWHACRPSAGREAAAILKEVVRWVYHPTESNRGAAAPADPSTAVQTAAGSLALAVAWSGGSLSRSDLPVVPPPAYLTGRAVAHAILLAAVQREPQLYLDHYRQYLALGLEVASCKNLWTKPEDDSAGVEAVAEAPESAAEELAAVGD